MGPVLVDVGPRDGLQDEPIVLDPRTRADYANRLANSGFRRIEVTSFVNPERVPQMADAERVVENLSEASLAASSALVLNEQGLQRAHKSGLGEINYVVVSTDTFSLRNQGFSTSDSIKRWSKVWQLCQEHGIRTTLTLAAAFGCPFEGEVPVDRLRCILSSVVGSPPDEICLADTIGVAVPTDIVERLDLVKEVVPQARTRLHCHNTRNTGLANAYAATIWGVEALDASTGGLGGCPFSPSSTGNVPSEDLIYMLERMGHDTGIRLLDIIDTASWVCAELNRTPTGMVVSAGQFPPVVDSTD